jgi:hypothetical protein
VLRRLTLLLAAGGEAWVVLLQIAFLFATLTSSPMAAP